MRGSTSASTAGIRRSRCSTSPPGTTRAASTRPRPAMLGSCTRSSPDASAPSTAPTSGMARQYNFNGDGGNGLIANGVGFFVSDSWRMKPTLTLTGGLRYEIVFPIKDNWGLSAPEDWKMVYGLTGAGSGDIGQGNLFKPGTFTGQNPVFKQYDNSNSAYKTDWNNVAPSIGAAWRPAAGKQMAGDAAERRARDSWRLLDVLHEGCDGLLQRDIWRATRGRRGRAAARSHSGTPTIGFDGFPLLLRETNRLTPGTQPPPRTYPFAPAVTNEHVPGHRSGRGNAADPPGTASGSSASSAETLRSRSATSVTPTSARPIPGTSTATPTGACWPARTGSIDEFRRAQANLRANIVAGNGTTFAFTGAPGTSPLPIFQAFFAGTPLNNSANQNPASLHQRKLPGVVVVQQLNYFNANSPHPGFVGIAGFGTSGLQNTSFENNRIAAGLPANFFRANTYLGSGSEATPADHCRQAPIQRDPGRTASPHERRACARRQLSAPVPDADEHLAVAARCGAAVRRQHGRSGARHQGQLGVRTALRPGQDGGAPAHPAGRTP